MRTEHTCTENTNNSIHIVRRQWTSSDVATWRLSQGLIVSRNTFDDIKFCPYCGTELVEWGMFADTGTTCKGYRTGKTVTDHCTSKINHDLPHYDALNGATWDA